MSTQYVFCAFTDIRDRQGNHEIYVLTPLDGSRGTVGKAVNYKSNVNKVVTVLGNVYPVEAVMR